MRLLLGGERLLLGGERLLLGGERPLLDGEPHLALLSAPFGVRQPGLRESNWPPRVI